LRVLLHSCCAPCTTFPLFILRAEGFLVDGIFFNPNIFPSQEEEKRWKVYKTWADEVRLDVRRLESNHKKWLAHVSRDLSKPGRCRFCYSLRLREVARWAKKRGYDFFTTTLLVSPYQDHQSVLGAMKTASTEFCIPYIYRDFRVGYGRSRQIARGSHLYMQKYCGCEFSHHGR